MDNKLTIDEVELAHARAYADKSEHRHVLKQLHSTMRENERLREALGAFANAPEILKIGLDEDDNCIMCGFSHKNAAEFAHQALQQVDDKLTIDEVGYLVEKHNDAGSNSFEAKLARQLYDVIYALSTIEGIGNEDYRTGTFLTGKIPDNWAELAIADAKNIARAQLEECQSKLAEECPECGGGMKRAGMQFCTKCL